MKLQELAYLGTDPGAVKHGNFMNYYTFHAAKERIDKMNSQMFPSAFKGTIICLDIGCNSGELTTKFYKYLVENYPDNDVKVLAIDIDSGLINRAKELNTDGNVTFVEVDIMSDLGKEQVKEFLDLNGRDRFDITLCFSITMWIHLNNGDDGLLTFLTFIKEISGTILVESQPWSCYRNAQRRLRKQGKDFPLYHSLKIKGSSVNKVIGDIIAESTHIKVYESPDSMWKRKIESFELLK